MNLNTQKPYNFEEIKKINYGFTDTDYNQYLKDWYLNKNQTNLDSQKSFKDQYIQLLKDLSSFFSEDEKNLFLKDIDLNNREDVLTTIPFYVKKLKEIIKSIKNNRQSLKKTTIENSFIGSLDGLEKILYSYILKNFTQDDTILEIPKNIFSTKYPQFSAVKDNFTIEIEDLYDDQTYHDKDPKIDIGNIPKLSDSLLSKIFVDLLNEDSDYANNLIKLNQKNIGDFVYALTAIKLRDVSEFDDILNLNLKIGNNWFYFPSGTFLKNNDYFNFYEPIKLNDSNFVLSAFGESDFKSSDLFFAKTKNTIEGAWFMDHSKTRKNDILKLTINSGEKKIFKYPFVYFTIDLKTTKFKDYSLNDDFKKIIDLLLPDKKNELFDYYFSNYPQNSTVEPKFLNQTNIINCGAYASETNENADNLFVYTSSSNLNFETLIDPVESAFLYKIKKTDLFIEKGLNYIYWPYTTYSDGEIPITILNDCCLNINLKDVNPIDHLGATAGFTFNDSDVIFKFDDKFGQPIEAAYLRTSPIDVLDIESSSNIQIYDRIAEKCSKYFTGPIQRGLGLKINAGEKVSFVWTDVDTYADDVFKFFKHSEDCEYSKIENDFYSDQTYKNKNYNNWEKCNCKSVYYSPIGHVGENFYDYNSVCDILFHDVDGVGSDFSISNWKDTRNLTYKNSPQFSFYKLKNGDKNVGWGDGVWKTSNGERMVLKAGRRYTYYRTFFRNLELNSPFYVVKYPFKNIIGICEPQEIDMVILWDISKSQEDNFEFLKSLLKKINNRFLKNGGIKISILAFSKKNTILSYLNTNSSVLNLLVSNLQQPKTYPEYRTNLKNALELAYYILTTDINSSEEIDFDLKNLCSNLNAILENYSENPSINKPRKNASKKIIILSDGDENEESIDVLLKSAENIKNSGVQIYSLDIGVNSSFNDNLEKIATDSILTYTNLQKSMINGSETIDSFVENYYRLLNGCGPIYPKWHKAIRDNNGEWVGTDEESDMILRAGDYLGYIHRETIQYDGETQYNSFLQNCIDFTINQKLDGWDYSTQNFSPTAIGPIYGAKPFWAKSYNTIDQKNNFIKETDIFGGHVRFLNEYVPISQPEISDILLDSTKFLEYFSKNNKPITWIEPIVLSVKTPIKKWKKLKFKVQPSNLEELLKNNNYDLVVEQSMDDSTIVLEGYSRFEPLIFNYFSKTPKNIIQGLKILNNKNSFVIYSSGVYISPKEPYKNLTNIHYPTIAYENDIQNLKSISNTGFYLRPDKLGTSYYLGRGFSYKIDNSKLSTFDTLSADKIFYDLTKYGNRNRGFSKNDQLTIVSIDKIINKWVYENFLNSKKSGMLKPLKQIQKFTPYDSNYELKNIQFFGISSQEDNLQITYKLDDKNLKLNFKKELTIQSLIEKIKTFLSNSGIATDWCFDNYGSQYMVYKENPENTVILTEYFMSILSENFEEIIIE